ncbi:MAG: hypothetical protein ACRER2_18465, partial [Methylococcales bacterium]
METIVQEFRPSLENKLAAASIQAFTGMHNTHLASKKESSASFTIPKFHGIEKIYDWIDLFSTQAALRYETRHFQALHNCRIFLSGRDIHPVRSFLEGGLRDKVRAYKEPESASSPISKMRAIYNSYFRLALILSWIAQTGWKAESGLDL